VHPEIFHLGPFVLRSYGLALAIAFLVGIWLATREAKARGWNPDAILNLGLVVLAAGVAGSRFLYVFGHVSEFQGRWLHVFALWEGGLTLWGGFLFAVPIGISYCARTKLPTWEAADILAGPTAIGAAIGRFGCFLNGCCYGTPTKLPWGIRFPEGSLPFQQFGNQPLHPSQLYNVLAGLVTYVVVTLAAPHLKAPGQRWWLMLGLYAVLRAAVDTTRYYEPSAYLLHIGSHGIAESELVGGLLFVWSLILFFLMGNVHKAAQAQMPTATEATTTRVG